MDHIFYNAESPLRAFSQITGALHHVFSLKGGPPGAFHRLRPLEGDSDLYFITLHIAPPWGTLSNSLCVVVQSKRCICIILFVFVTVLGGEGREKEN